MEPTRVVRISTASMELGESRIPTYGLDHDVAWLVNSIDDLEVDDRARVLIRVIFGSADDDNFFEQPAAFDLGKLFAWLRSQAPTLKVVFEVDGHESAIGDIEVADDPKDQTVSLYFYSPCGCEDDDYQHGHEPCCRLSRHYEPPL